MRSRLTIIDRRWQINVVESLEPYTSCEETKKIKFHLRLRSLHHQWRIQKGKIRSWSPIQFGHKLWLPLQRRRKCEILGNILNCPPAECLDLPHEVAPYSQMPGSATVHLHSLLFVILLLSYLPFLFSFLQWCRRAATNRNAVPVLIIYM